MLSHYEFKAEDLMKYLRFTICRQSIGHVPKHFQKPSTHTDCFAGLFDLICAKVRAARSLCILYKYIYIDILVIYV